MLERWLRGKDYLLFFCRTGIQFLALMQQLTLSITLGPREPIFSPNLCGHKTCIWYTWKKTHTHKINLFCLGFKKKKDRQKEKKGQV